jgi:hypothetical protein
MWWIIDLYKYNIMIKIKIVLKILPFIQVDLVACSHSRVIRYYAQSVRSINLPCKFQSVICSSYGNPKQFFHFQQIRS